MWLRALLEEGDALVDVPRVPVDGRRRDAGEVVRQEAAGSVVVAVGGAVAAALPVRGAAGEEALPEAVARPLEGNVGGAVVTRREKLSSDTVFVFERVDRLSGEPLIDGAGNALAWGRTLLERHQRAQREAEGGV